MKKLRNFWSKLKCRLIKALGGYTREEYGEMHSRQNTIHLVRSEEMVKWTKLSATREVSMRDISDYPSVNLLERAKYEVMRQLMKDAERSIVYQTTADELRQVVQISAALCVAAPSK